MAYAQENIFKLYLFDVGLLGALSHLQPQTIYEYTFCTFKGYFAENFVLQEFLTSGTTPLYSWQEKTAELEFLYDLQGAIIPIEVKSGWVTKSKSLSVFKERYAPPWRCVFGGKNLKVNKQQQYHCYPLYLAGRFPLSCEEGEN